MHMPEMWGYLQFSSIMAEMEAKLFIPDKDLDLKWALRMVYYAENEYFTKTGKYSSSFKDIGLAISDLPKILSFPVIHSTRTTFEVTFLLLNHNPV